MLSSEVLSCTALLQAEVLDGQTPGQWARDHEGCRWSWRCYYSRRNVYLALITPNAQNVSD